MRKSILAVAVTALAFAAGSANAALTCKVSGAKPEDVVKTGTSYANSKVLVWHWGQAFPNTTGFDYKGKPVVCFVDGGILYNVIPLIGGLSKVGILSNGATQGPGSGPKVGLVYRDAEAQFLIDNLKSIPYDAQGTPNSGNAGVDFADFAADVKP